jgi:outer membrane protein assembly factor BamB
MRVSPFARKAAATGRRGVAGLLVPALLAALAVLPGCASTSDKTAKPTALTPIAAPLALRRAWEVDLGDSEDTFLRPSVLENAIYAASRKGKLYRVDPVTGREVWQRSVDGGIAAGVGSDGLTVAVAGPRGNIVAFNAEGKRLWEAQASSDVLAPPLVGHELVVVRSTDQRVAAYDATSGKRLWVFQKQQPALSLRAEAELAFAGDSLLVGFPGGRLAAIALANGAGRWEGGVSEPKGATEVERLADVFGAPALFDNDVCTASYQGRVTCFDNRNGDLRWAREFSAGTGVAVSREAVIGIDATSHINAFARDTGAGLWQTGALANRRLSSPVVIGKYVAVGDYEGIIHVLALEDGRLAGRFDASGGPVISTPQVWNGGAVFQTARGRLFLLNVAGG